MPVCFFKARPWALLLVWTWAGFLLPAAAQQTVDAIVARVNGDPITLSDLREAAFDQDVPLSALMAEGMHGEGFRRALTQVVDQTLLTQYATAQGIKPDDVELARRVDEMIQTLKERMKPPQTLEDFLAQRHLTLDDVRALMLSRERKRTLEAQALARRISISAQEIKDYEAQCKQEGKPLTQVKLAQILIECTREQRRQQDGRKIYIKALDVARSAGAWPEKFEQLCREHSTDPALRESGGQLGWLDPQDLLPALSRRVATMHLNEISEPVESERGYHILWLQDRRTSRDLLFAEKYTQQRTELLGRLREEAQIDLFDLGGEKLSE